MKKAAITLLLFWLLVMPAQAHLVKHYSKGMTQHMRTHRHVLNLKHAAYVCARGSGKIKKAHCRAERWLREALIPPAPPIAHWSLWSCITNGAYPGAPHEGNGYNGLYTGWLGMSTPWMGHYPPGSDWVHSAQSAVYAIAEQEYRESGYSLAWLHGQWPATSPPCS